MVRARLEGRELHEHSRFLLSVSAGLANTCNPLEAALTSKHFNTLVKARPRVPYERTREVYARARDRTKEARNCWTAEDTTLASASFSPPSPISRPPGESLLIRQKLHEDGRVYSGDEPEKGYKCRRRNNEQTCLQSES